jgi:asparagine synthase (glutamine-hydrolysing)
MMVADAMTYLPDDILCKVDRAAMSVSLETRVPFLDPDVVALAWRLPLSLKIRRGETKWILRRLLERYVPPDRFERPKQGFAVPLAAWLRGPLRAWTGDLVAGLPANDPWLDKAAIARTLQDHEQGRADQAQALWPVLMFLAWREARQGLRPADPC